MTRARRERKREREGEGARYGDDEGFPVKANANSPFSERAQGRTGY